MRRQPQEFHAKPGAQKAGETSIAAPIGGLNARDSIANMPNSDAVILENWFPKTTSVDVRNGYTAWSTFTGVCQTIMVYTGLVTTKVFPCVKNGSTYSVYDGTTAGALSSAVVGGGGTTVEALSSCRFDYANFGTTGGQYFVAVNGANTPLQYDGTTWIVSAMTGLTTANLISVGVYKRRLWFIEKDTFNIWYLAVDSITGALTKLHVGPLFKLGGFLNSIITVTDAYQGVLADYIGFLSSEGEVVAFSGTDPSSSTTWTQSAHFRIGRPVIKGNRTWCKHGSDALVMCADGVFPLRQAIQSDRQVELAISDKIRPLINSDFVLYAAKYDWQIIVHPTGGKLLVNVPTNEDVASYQYVMNTQSGSWCKFTGWSAFYFEVARDTLYMGLNGKMVKADVGALDGTSYIAFDARQAFNYFGTRGRTKHMKLMRPILAVDGTLQIAIGIDVDYTETSSAIYREVGTGTSGDPWGGIWDTVWSGAVVTRRSWYGTTGEGHAIAARLRGRNNGSICAWSATDFIYETGGPLG